MKPIYVEHGCCNFNKHEVEVIQNLSFPGTVLYTCWITGITQNMESSKHQNTKFNADKLQLKLREIKFISDEGM